MNEHGYAVARERLRRRKLRIVRLDQQVGAGGESAAFVRCGTAPAGGNGRLRAGIRGRERSGSAATDTAGTMAAGHASQGRQQRTRSRPTPDHCPGRYFPLPGPSRLKHVVECGDYAGFAAMRTTASRPTTAGRATRATTITTWKDGQAVGASSQEKIPSPPASSGDAPGVWKTQTSFPFFAFHNG